MAPVYGRKSSASDLLKMTMTTDPIQKTAPKKTQFPLTRGESSSSTGLSKNIREKVEFVIIPAKRTSQLVKDNKGKKPVHSDEDDDDDNDDDDDDDNDDDDDDDNDDYSG
ncbi:hypothetical protein BGZ65_008661, partial [Modicella reniformis]